MAPPPWKTSCNALAGISGVERDAILVVHTSPYSGQPAEQFVRRRRGTHHHRPGMWGLRGEPGREEGAGKEVVGYNTEDQTHQPGCRISCLAPHLQHSTCHTWFLLSLGSISVGQNRTAVGLCFCGWVQMCAGYCWCWPLNWHCEVLAH